MKKVCFIASILFVAVVSTACINNFAVQDLNNKAKIYTEKGDYVQAIERLKSSIDLDPSVVETHYNLAVVYTKTGDYVNAVEEYKKVIELKPDMADSYYSLATAENNLAVDISKMEIRLNEDGTLFNPGLEEYKDIEVAAQLTKDEKDFVNELYESAVENYKKYLELNPQAEDKSDVEAQIEKIKEAQNPDNKAAID